jgi:crotonobetainyl-CoA:carnitine CoA-transferase CaiB-like acyl-CoA transferase
MALYHRARSEESASISVPMLNVGLYMSSDIFQAPDGAFHSLPSVNHAQAGRHPSESMYAARDGWIAIAARGAAAARRLARALDLEERLDQDPKLWGEAEHVAIGAAVATRSLAELREILDEHDVWSEPCRRGVAEWFGDSRLRALGAVWEAPHARFGRVRHVGTQINFSRSPQSPGMLAPDLGQHTAEFLSQLAQSSFG